MMKLIGAGVYEAEIENYGISKTKAGLPMCVVDFSFKADGEEQQLRWFGSLSANAKKWTAGTLVDLGYKETTLGPFADGNGLDDTRKYFITVTVDNYNGKSRNKIEWINLTKGTSGLADPDEIKSLLMNVDISADIAFAKDQTQRDEVPKIASSKLAKKQDFDVNDIPF